MFNGSLPFNVKMNVRCRGISKYTIMMTYLAQIEFVVFQNLKLSGNHQEDKVIALKCFL